MAQTSSYWHDDQDGVVGIDEVGRGPLAGPVVAAAVILGADYDAGHLTDSKKLSARKRDSFSAQVTERALAVAIGVVEVQEIDEINILNASLLAMQRAVARLPTAPGRALVDGNRCPELSCQVEAIVKGDCLVPAISAASIVAKVYRDNLMLELDGQYPGYGFASHKGYPTASHIEALRRLGVSPVHRRSFKPVRDCLNDDAI